MKKIKTAWLNFILHISAKINRSKEAIVDGGILQTLGVALKIVMLEALLLVVSLPIYIFISPSSFSNDKKEVQKYRLKRIISLVSVCTFIVIFLVTSIFSGGIFLVIPPAELRADSLGWSFDNAKDYTYDASKIQIIDGLVLFSPKDIAVKGLTEELEKDPMLKESLMEKLAETTPETTAPETTAPETTAAETTLETPVQTTAETTAAETTAAETAAETTAESAPIKSQVEKLSATATATIQALNSLIVPNVASWDSFTEVSGKNGGEIYYQLSDDAGQTWYYWNSGWAKAGENDYNTAKEIDNKIRDFPVDKGQILFKAFFVTDFNSEMQLLDISIAFSQKNDGSVVQQDIKSQSNQVPTANAGGPYSVEVNSTVKLDGSASSDADGTIISYSWKILEGPGSLTGQNSPVVTYKAPEKLDSAMKAIVELTVVDDNNESATDNANITVILISDAAPTFSGAVITGTAKVGITLTAAGVGYDDVNGDLAAETLYQWTICDTADGTYTDIPGETSDIYTPVNENLDKFIKVKVTPTALTGTSPGTPVTSSATTAVLAAEAAPAFTGATITGTAKVGVALTAAGVGYNDVNGDLAGTPLYQWTSCSTAGGTYANISGATNSTYTPVFADIGKFIKVIITPAALTGTSPGIPVTSSATVAILAAPAAAPTFTGATITGTAKVGVALTAAGVGYNDVNGDLAGTPLYQWISSSTSGGTYANISGATGSTYTPSSSYLGKFIKVLVTPTALTGTSPGTPVTSIATAAVLAAEAAPSFTGATITGTAKVGVALTAAGVGYNDVNGDLAGTPLYQWTSCSTAGGTYANISGATGSTYTPSSSYLGKFIKVKVTPTAQSGSSPGTTVTSTATAAVKAAEAAPTFTGATITGTAKVGVALTAAGVGYSDVNGDLAGTPLYQWINCNTASGTYTDITDATGSTYTPVNTDSGKFIKVKITPTALTGTSPGIPVTSTATTAVKAAEAAPTFTGATITGTAKVGVALTAAGVGYSDVNGDLAGTPLYQWTICSTVDGIYIDITSATGSTYTPVTLDSGKYIIVEITPTAKTGTSPGTMVISSATAAVLAAEAAPTFTGATITGTAKVGVALTAAGVGYNDVNGDLAATPLYQWTLCITAGGTYANISGATGSTYTPVTTDLGKFIKVNVTPKAQTGSLTGTLVTSSATAAVLAAEAAPAFTSAQISGIAQVGAVLTAAGVGYSDVNGDIAGAPLYQWTISSTSGGTYTNISGATDSTYTPLSTDLGKFLKVKITPTALSGTTPGATVTSSATAAISAVPAAAPAFTGATITGTAKVGVALTAAGVGYSDVNGDIAGTPLYQWTICSTAGGTYVNISGATSNTYIPVNTDSGKFIKVIVTPTALSGTSPGAPVTSSATAAVLAAEAAPTFTGAAITGTAKVGVALTAAGVGYSDINGDIAGTPLYQWTISSTADGTYTNISGATSSTYIPVNTDSGKFIKVIVTPTALTGTSPGTPVTSSATAAVLAAEAAPTFTGATITGTAKVGVALTAAGVGYNDVNGDPSATPLYQWTICDTADGVYIEIYGATDSTYTPSTADLGKFLKVIVTPTAQTGMPTGSSVTSSATAVVLAAEAAPVFAGATITGTAKVGVALTAAGVGYSDINGDIAGTPLYQWTICGTANGTYTDMPGATNSTYTPVTVDLGKFIKVIVTPTAQTGMTPGTPMTSSATAAVLAAEAAPAFTGAAITGTAKVGVVLTAAGVGYNDVNGDLEGTPLYQWTICNTVGGTYSNISGATGSTYIPVAADPGKFIKVIVTPKALTGTSPGMFVTSSATAAVLEAEAVPEFTGAAINGTAKIGLKLTAAGTGYSDINGDPSATPLYQWTICDTADGVYIEIYGATDSTYTPSTADLGKFLKVNITPTAQTGMPTGSSVTSSATAAVLAAEAAPSFSSAAITGKAKIGVVLTASGLGYTDINEDLEGTPIYQWTICGTANGTYTDMPGATNSTYTPVTVDLGKFIKVIVTPTAQTGMTPGTPMTSSATAAVLAAEAAPAFTGAAITGTAKVGVVLTAAGVGYNDVNGDLEGTPLYQWTICNTVGGTYSNISGATGSTYIPVAADLGKFIKVIVTPKALTGTSPGMFVTSSATAAVLEAEAVPEFTGAAINGTAKIGLKLTAAGTGYSDINGDPSATPLYQWTICDTADGVYIEIYGATDSTYTPSTADLGKFLKVNITPTAQTGMPTGSSVTSSATAAVLAAEAAPSFSSAAITGKAKIGVVLTASGLGYTDINEDLEGTPIYQWTICGTANGTYTDMPGATNSTYTPVTVDLGKFIKVIVTPTAQTGMTPGTPMTSSATAAVLAAEAAPAFTGAAITGTAKVGVVLTAAGVGYNDVNGDLEGTPLYQWTICNTVGGTYSNISGATGSTYIPVAADLGKFIKVIVTPKALTGTSPGMFVTSSATAAVLEAEAVPEFTGAAINGTAKIGLKLTAAGTGYSDINGDPSATPLYQWTICDTADGVYIEIYGATDSTYTPSTADLGKFLKVNITPTAQTGMPTGSSVTSSATAAVLAAEAAPSFSSAAITGKAKIGVVLTASGLGYTDINEDLEGTPIYQWTICGTANGTYTDMPGATNSTYTPVTVDLGKFIKVIVTPTAQTGMTPGTPMTSSATAAVLAAEAAPAFTGAVVNGTVKIGLEITATGTGYSDINGDPSATPLYQWTICDTADGVYIEIYGATDSTYTPSTADLGKFLKVNITPTAQTGMPTGSSVTSSATAVVLAAEAAPAFSSTVIKGTGKVGSELTASGMGYSDVNDDLEATPLYQWKISSTSGGEYTDISGATTNSYTPTVVDIGKFIKVAITPTAQTGSSSGTPVESDAIKCYSGKPIITINSAAQQTDYGYIYIGYTLIDAENHPVDLSDYEYSLTGDFTGEESSMTAAILDGKHDGILELSSSATGTGHTFVWDVLSDLPAAHNLNLYIRLKPNDSIEQGEFATSDAYIAGFKKPAISDISALQTEGTNKVVVRYDLSADNDKLQVTLEISEDDGATWTSLDAGISGDAGPAITPATEKTITWDTDLDFKGKDNPDMQIRLAATGAWQNKSDYAYSSNFALDTKAPLGLNDFTGVSSGISSVVWSWTPVTSETNFKYYRISYGQNLQDVQNQSGTALVWGTSDDIDLSIAGTAGTIITGLSEGTKYYAKIWAIDDFGNQSTVLESQFTTKSAQNDNTAPPFTPILNQPPASSNQPGILVSGIADINSDNDLYVDGEIVISGFAQTQSDGKFNGTIKLDEGKHEIYIMSKDSDGNSSKRSNIINVDIDFEQENNQTSETISTITEKAGTDEATIIKDVYKAVESSVLQRPQVIEVKGIDAGNNIKFVGTGVANSEVIVFIHSEQVIAYRVQVDESGNWSLNHSQDNAELAEGGHEVYALTLDAKSQAKSRISDIKKFQVEVNPLAVFLSYFDLPTTLLTIFVLLMGIVVFIIWRKKQTKINKNNGNTAEKR